MYLKMLSCAVLAAAGTLLAGTEYFVDAKGSDKNPGTAAKPFRSVRKAISVVKPGDVVTLKPGIHSGNLTIKTSGTAEKPITFQGVRGKNGEFLSIIDPGVPVKGWVPAPEIAKGVWKAPVKKRPASVLLDGKLLTYIARLRMALPRRKSLPLELTDPDFAFKNTPPPYDRSKLLPGFDLLSLPKDILVFHKQVDWRLKKKQAFWPAIGNVICGWSNGYLYIRFADGASPVGKNITAGTGNGFFLKNKGHIIIQDLMIRGVGSSVFMIGKEASGNIIRRNHMMHGTTRVHMENGAANNLIEDNYMTLGYIGAANHGSGFWRKNRVIYLTFKYIAGDRQTSNDNGVLFRNPGAGNIIRRNLIYQGLIGIGGTEGGKVQIYDNFVREMSSVGIVSGYSSQSEIHDNYIMDCGINLRVHSIRYASVPRTTYIYRNVLHQSPDFGMQFFFSTSNFHPKLAENIWIYNNTVYKSSAFGNPISFYRSYGDKEKHPIRMLNNLFYLKNPPFKQNFQIFTNNMIPDSAKGTILKGDFGCNPMMTIEEKMFSPLMDGKFAALQPAKNSPLCKQGLDLSKPFTINGKTYPALPGMKKGETCIGARRSPEQLAFQKKMFLLSEQLRTK